MATSRSLASVAKTWSEGYIATAGISRASSSAPSRAAWDARRVRPRGRPAQRRRRRRLPGRRAAVRAAAGPTAIARGPPRSPRPASQAITAAAAQRGRSRPAPHDGGQTDDDGGAPDHGGMKQHEPERHDEPDRDQRVKREMQEIEGRLRHHASEKASDSATRWRRRSRRPPRRPQRSPQEPPALSASTRSRGGATLRRSIRFRAVQTSAAKNSAVKRRSSGAVGRSRGIDGRRREPEEHAGGHERSDDRGRGDDDGAAIARSTAHVDEGAGAQQDRDGADRQDGGARPTAPVSSRRREIGRGHFSHDQQLSAARGNDERVRRIGRRHADARAQGHRHERGREHERVRRAGRQAYFARAAARRQSRPAESPARAPRRRPARRESSPARAPRA